VSYQPPLTVTIHTNQYIQSLSYTYFPLDTTRTYSKATMAGLSGH